MMSLSVSPALCEASSQLRTLICVGWSLLACSAFMLSARMSSTGMFWVSSQSYVGIKRDRFCFHAFQYCVTYSYVSFSDLCLSVPQLPSVLKCPSQDLSGVVNGLSEVVCVSWFEIKSILLIKQSAHAFFFFFLSFIFFFFLHLYPADVFQGPLQLMRYFSL